MKEKLPAGIKGGLLGEMGMGDSGHAEGYYATAKVDRNRDHFWSIIVVMVVILIVVIELWS